MPSSIKKLDSVSVDTFIEKTAPFAEGHACDLCEFGMITPGAMAQLAAGCTWAAQDGQTPLIRVKDDAVRSYLIRSGFFETLGGVVEVEPAIPPSAALAAYRRGMNPLLIEMTQIKNGSELPKLLDRIVFALRRRLKYRKHDAYDVAMTISEACQNTFDHNANGSGFIAMQGYGKGAKRFLEIGISDCGDGLTATLRRNPKNGVILNDQAALAVATKLGTSEHDDPTRGTGLFHLLEIAYRHEGSVQIKSGAAKVRYRMDRKQGWSFRVAPIRGVHVALTLPTKAT